MVANPGFEMIISRLESERKKFSEILASFESGTLSLKQHTPSGKTLPQVKSRG